LVNSVSGSPSWTKNKLVSVVMSIAGIKFKTKTASEHEILNHLSECNNSFIPPLSNKVYLISYSKKIVEKAITFEAWNEDKLAGLIAAYFNDSEKRTGYITNVSIVPEFAGKGIGSELLLNCIDYAMKEDYYEIKLEVNKLNIKGISLYKKHNFVQIDERDDNIIMKWNKQSKANCRIVSILPD
jgi:ribosomal protein S18 acetylase RimI-like enzyme